MLKNIRKVSGAQMGVLRICLPPALAANVGINPGGKVSITIEKGKLVVSPIPDPRPKVSGIGTRKNKLINPKRR
ncbi:hypothetical protein J7W08_04135 [Methanococcoides orientis]|uniref:AbrB/MazE/SpoVT family DNA-binding domain-containing protein n=1 Tax=Methanococcoides orientis TaxID=2822137 RepID=UPI001E5B8505|nr:hypothetical protein [Methanococcoides orientis]UGV41488.1 hypothetical protein J7W08_04135 [Methanococcoides orientis]